MRLILVLSLVVIFSIWGLALDRSDALIQKQIFLALQAASLSGILLGAIVVARNYRSAFAWLFFLVLALAAWRLSYFPIMVFSGHVASIGEWIQLSLGLSVVIYPIFLCAVFSLNFLSTRAFIKLIHRPRWLFTGVAIPVFIPAFAVSFSDSKDWSWLPDSTIELVEEIPLPSMAERNPYLSALSDSRYGVRQRVMLVAAGVTYETIPPSPWATSVKAVLEGLFSDNPVASTHGRVVEHYQAYHSAHTFIGCQSFEECPIANISTEIDEQGDVSVSEEETGEISDH